ncbi:MAG: glycosyltransferase [Acidobacteriia bacterium]|nr:glycosyltransferase [Terriglobia bacterium]
MTWPREVDRVVACIPHFKCKAHIRRAVESLLRQTHRNLTIVVANDGDADPPWIERVWLSYWTLTRQAARTALRSGRSVSSIAGPHRSLRARARSCTMC